MKNRRNPLTTGPRLIKWWDMPVRQAKFHRDGWYYDPLTRFPAAYCDCNGFIIFQTQNEFLRCPYVHVFPGGQVNVERGISVIPGYQKVPNPIIDQ